MTTTPHYDRCAHCRRRFQQRMGPGRKKDYCDTRCRRLAQRQRDGQAVQLPAAAASPWGRDVAEDLQSLVAELVEAEQRRQPLPVLLALATRLGKELTYYTAAAVQDARSRGLAWEHIAAAAGVAVDTARLRWAEARIKRLLERRARERLARPPALPGRALPMPRSPKQKAALPTAGTLPRRKLGQALSHLQRTSSVTVSEAAEQADLSPSYVSRILAGDRIPAWPVAHTLATIFGGRPAELRILWEAAQGIAHPSRQTVDGAAQRLHAALRGLYLAAACPDLNALAQSTGLTPHQIRGVLDGEHIPDWATTSVLISRLAAQPATLRPLWEDVHYAFLASHDIFPPGGLARGTLPDADPDPPACQPSGDASLPSCHPPKETPQ